jgi:hypothetical protein
MILTGGNGSTVRKTFPNAALSKKSPTWIGLGLNQFLRGERPVTNRQRYGMTDKLTNSLY